MTFGGVKFGKNNISLLILLLIRGAWREIWRSDRAAEGGDEFGGLGPAPRQNPADAPQPRKRMGEATTIAIVATDAALTQSQVLRLATAAHDGMARAIVPSHTPLDGDLVFAAATGACTMADPLTDSFQLGHAAATCLARAIARAVFLAKPLPGDLQPTWNAR